ncbi:MAG: hypothetical protein JW927_18155, partial [Deltaproteobacteria bacterium]|nr:hypothetical protein [Deltaproteobacteria bacterium]
MSKSRREGKPAALGNYIIYIIIIWTVLIAASLTWSLYQRHEAAVQMVNGAASLNLEKNFIP